jgi:hypothetical protein
MISLEEAIEAGLSQQAITHQVETGRIHFTASAEDDLHLPQLVTGINLNRR